MDRSSLGQAPTVSERPAPPRRRNRRRTFVIIIVLACCLLLEGFASLAYKLVLSPAERGAISPLRNNTYQSIIWKPHPYSLITLNPRGENGGIHQINSLGFRGPETTAVKAPGTIRIVCLGGSTTYGTGVDKPELSYPLRMQEYLRSKTGNPKIEVLNGGISYASSFEVLSTFLYRVLPLDPDIVVTDVSINDVEPLLTKDYAEDYTHWRQNWVYPSSPLGLRILLHSSLASIFYAKVAQPQTKASSYQVQQVPIYAVDNMDLSPEIKSRRPTAYRRNLENLILVAQGRNVNVMMLNARNRKPLPHVDWVMALQREAMSELSAKYKVPICDYYSRFQLEPEHWVDINHLDAVGEERKAALAGGDLLANFGRIFGKSVTQ